MSTHKNNSPPIVRAQLCIEGGIVTRLFCDSHRIELEIADLDVEGLDPERVTLLRIRDEDLEAHVTTEVSEPFRPDLPPLRQYVPPQTEICDGCGDEFPHAHAHPHPDENAGNQILCPDCFLTATEHGKAGG